MCFMYFRFMMAKYWEKLKRWTLSSLKEESLNERNGIDTMVYNDRECKLLRKHLKVDLGPFIMCLQDENRNYMLFLSRIAKKKFL
jgi:hypothetical protein